MKKIAAVLLLLGGLYATGFAQSGRKARPTPTPMPSSSAPVVEEESGGYSDSVARIPLTRNDSASRRSRDNKSEEKSDRQNQPVKDATADGDEEEVVRVDTSLVTIPVSVVERSGGYVTGLRRNDFKIFEDGKEQEISYFATTEQPFTVVLLIDTSASTKYKIEDIHNAAITFVDQLQSQDSVMVIEFSSSVNVLSEPTNDREKLHKAIRRANFGNSTSLYDAVDYTIRRKLNKISGRKAIVLFTDGVDTSSIRATYNSTLKNIEESDALIFPVHYDTLNDFGGGGGVMTSPYPPGFPLPGSGGIQIGGSGNGSEAEQYRLGRRYLEELALYTGGRVFYTKWQSGGLSAAFEGIAEELRRQYSIGYYPQDAGEKGQRKQIKVRVNRPRLVIRTRDSYIVGENQTKPPAAASKE